MHVYATCMLKGWHVSHLFGEVSWYTYASCITNFIFCHFAHYSTFVLGVQRAVHFANHIFTLGSQRTNKSFRNWLRYFFIKKLITTRNECMSPQVNYEISLKIVFFFVFFSLSFRIYLTLHFVYAMFIPSVLHQLHWPAKKRNAWTTVTCFDTISSTVYFSVFRFSWKKKILQKVVSKFQTSLTLAFLKSKRCEIWSEWQTIKVYFESD